MPQIEQISEIFASQLFWLLLTFGLVYLVIGRGMVPKVLGTVEARDNQIAADLAEAERARAAADEIEDAYRLRQEAARADALKVTQAARDAAAGASATRIRASDAELESRVAAAEVRVATARDVALGEIDTVAADAARDLVARLAGIEVGQAEAAAAVRNQLNAGA